jgi:hypothetical protein
MPMTKGTPMVITYTNTLKTAKVFTFNLAILF